MIRLLLGISFGLLTSADAEAQIFRRSSPQPAPIYRTPSYPTPIVVSAPTTDAAIVVAPPPMGSACPCGPAIGGVCGGICVAPPKIYPISGVCPPSTTFEEIAYIITPPTPVTCVTIPFYGDGVPFASTVPVPVTTEVCQETWLFETLKLDILCCRVVVCVPCKKVFTKKSECKEVPKANTKLVAYMRHDNSIDVYVEDKIPGMPTKYVQQLGLSEETFKTTFPGTAVPKPPSPKP